MFASSWSKWMVSVLVGVALIALPAPAQNITGTIAGAVEDQTGARIAGASAAATHTGTGIVYRTATTEAGLYALPLLPLGTYEVAVEAPGFKKFVQAGLTLSGDQRLRVDARLELGSVTEEVKVTAASPLIQTDQSVIGGTFTPAQFENLPISRNVLATVDLLPGVVNGVDGNFNGSRAYRTDYKVDGISATTANLGYIRIQPITELVEEVVVQTSNYSAELGRGAGQVSVTTRAGTNEFHGTLFHYFKNDVLNANNYMSNFYGNPRPAVRFNLFGGTIGGPILIPKLYDGHNRTFFTFAYEGSRQRSYGQSVSSVPTAAMRSGDFSGQAAISDPATTRPDGAGFARDPFPQNLIPQARMDPVSLKMLELSYPLPTLPGIANNYVRVGPSRSTADGASARVDHNISDKNRLTARYTYRRSLAANLMRYPGPAGAGAYTISENSNIFQHLVSADHTYLIRPNLINNVRFGFFQDYAPKGGPGTQEGWAQKVGLKNVGPDKFPQVNITALSPFGSSNLADQRPARDFHISESMTALKGRHSLKTGFEFRTLRSFFWQPQRTEGWFTFDTLPTMDPRTRRNGVGFASYLLGIPSNTQFELYPKEGFTTMWNYFAGYLQDDVRLNNRLVLNLGLRWETTTPRTERNNWQSNFDLRTLELQYAGQNGYPETLYDLIWNQFAPRIGFAYSPFGGTRTVIRAGYGIFYLPMNATGDGSFHTGPWRRQYTFVSPDSGITFPVKLRDGVPPVSNNDPFVLSPLTDVTWRPRDYPDAYMQEWSFNIQREMFARTMLEIGYVGTKGNNLQEGQQLNQVPRERLGPGDAQSRRPYPTRGNITANQVPIGASTYHSLQMRFERRLAGGFAAQGAYTFSKSIDDDGNQDNFNRRLEKSVSGFDVAHSLRYSFTYQLPAGAGRRWLSKGGVAEKILGGWNLSTLSIVQSGAPLSMGTVSNLTGSLGGGSRPNRLRDGLLLGEARGLARWFDSSAFALPDPFTFGNTSRTEPGLRAPGSFNLSLLLAKAFQLAEHKSLHVRSEFFNALNHFNPGAPNTGIGSPAVGTIVGGSGGRTIQLSLKLYY